MRAGWWIVHLDEERFLGPSWDENTCRIKGEYEFRIYSRCQKIASNIPQIYRVVIAIELRIAFFRDNPTIARFACLTRTGYPQR